jgi:hypothetical protein
MRRTLASAFIVLSILADRAAWWLYWGKPGASYRSYLRMWLCASAQNGGKNNP